MRSGSRQAKRKLDLWSRRDYCALDGRLVEAKAEKKLVGELTRHVGQPSVPQQLLIRRAARLLIMLAILERRCIESGDLGDLQSRQICALHNALRLSLAALGLTKP